MASLNDTQIGQAIYQLLNAGTLAQVKSLFQTYPWLISTEVDDKLTKVITNKRRDKQLPSVAIYTAARSLLRRCRMVGIDSALAAQFSWPLSTQGPLTQFLALDPTVPAEWRISRANAALQDVDPEIESDIYSLILGLSYQAETNPSLNEALIPAVESLELVSLSWKFEDSLVDATFMQQLCHNLGYLYLNRPGGNRSQNVEKSLYWLRQAQNLAEPNSPEHIDVLFLMGSASLERIEDERLKNIEQSLDYYEQAYQLAKSAKVEKRLGEIEHNMAVAYRLRLNGSYTDNYEQSREWAEKALKRFDRYKTPLDWARTTLELATIYGHRQHGNRADNLEQAIKYAEQALEIYQANTYSRQRALAQLILGNLYCDRIFGSPVENYQRAIACFQAVRNQRDRVSNPIGWAEAMNNLGTAYAGLSVISHDQNYRQAVDCFQQTLQVHKTETLSARARHTAANWGNLAFRFGEWTEAQQAFQLALEAGESLYQVSSTEAGRRVEVAESTGLAAKVAFCLLMSDPPAPTEALLQLEQGKTRLLTEAMALGDADLAGLSENQRKQTLAARRKVRELEAEMRLPTDTPARHDDRDLAARLGQARAELNQVIADIRKDNPDFMPTGLDLPSLLALIPPGGVLVAPLVTAQGGAVFVLSHGAKTVGIEHLIWLDDLTGDKLGTLLVGPEDKPGWVRAYTIYQAELQQAHEILSRHPSFVEAQNALQRIQTATQKWWTALERLTGQLWDMFIGPIHERLQSLGLTEGAPVLLMPQGGLGLLPLHAAWRKVKGRQRTFLDDYTVTYAPSGYALNVSQRRLADERRQSLSLLAVVNPTGDLPYTPIEGETVAALFDRTARRLLIGREATPKAVIEAVSGRTYLHFSSHGSYDWQNVMHSHLLLAGKTPLTLAEIISQLDLSAARLVTLSACETGMTEFQQSPDEYLGLPAGFLQAGAPGVISTLWAVDDLSTALLIGRFYQYHVQDKLPPPIALRKAQLWLRDELTGNDVNLYRISHLEQSVADLQQQEDEVRMSDPLLYLKLRQKRQTLENQLQAVRKELGQQGGQNYTSLFAHPYYWAAFTFTGA